MDIKNKVVIITGASQGFGRNLAKFFARKGAKLVLGARNIDLLHQLKEELLKEIESEFSIEILKCDVSRQSDNDLLVKTALSAFGAVDVFIANAGVYGPKGPIESIDWNEWLEAISINLNGVVLGCRSIVPEMKKKCKGKIIILSGGGATKPMPNFASYATTKAGVVRFAETLAEELRDFNIDVNTVAPGALNTQLLEQVLREGPEVVGQKFYEQAIKQKSSGGTSLDIGAELCVFLASSASDGLTGKLISAVWDDWKSFTTIIDVLAQSDIYTLRRIVPEDRK